MDRKRFHICYIGEQRKQFKLVNEILCFFRVPLDLEGKDRTAAVWEIFLVKFLLLRIIGYGRMVYLFYLWLIL